MWDVRVGVSEGCGGADEGKDDGHEEVKAGQRGERC